MKESNFLFKDTDFLKSSWSKNNPQTCVLIAKNEKTIAIRDSKDKLKTTLYLSIEEWEAFKKEILSQEF